MDNQVAVDRYQSRADQVVALARRHADEIRAAAEQEADRVLREAEQTAARRQEEQLEADRRERVRFGVQRRQIEQCLDATSSTLAQIRELIAVLPETDSPQPASERRAPIAVPAVSAAEAPDPAIASVAGSTDDRSSRGQRLVNGFVILLGLWAATMMVTLFVVKQRSPLVQATSIPAEQTPRSNAAPRPEAPPSSRQAAQATVAATGATPPSVAAVSASRETGLTVAFVASRDCWVSITSDGGATKDRLLKASERYVVRARDAVTFKAGNAAALSVLINDRPTGPLGSEGQVVTRRITRENFRSFLLS